MSAALVECRRSKPRPADVAPEIIAHYQRTGRHSCAVSTAQQSAACGVSEDSGAHHAGESISQLPLVEALVAVQVKEAKGLSNRGRKLGRR